MAARKTIELEHEPFGAPFAGSLLLHGFVIAAVVFLAFFGHLRGAEWGNNQAPGAIQATLVSSAPTIPLPQEAPPTPNVLATETPSPAPAPPQPEVAPVPQPNAVPIPTKQPEKRTPEKKQAQPSPKHAQPQPLQNRAHYGEAPATQIPHSQAGNPGQNNPVNVNGGDFGSRFPYYVSIITNKVSQAWYRQEIDPRTPYGREAKVIFIVARDGTVSGIRLSQSSGSPSLDSSAVRAVQRIETFGPLPPAYSGSNVSVEYTFSNDQPSQ
ncbi:MAG TPA: TonB family protein [Silvibacterium sp.]|jgi:protein TonB|nr:TonB family protein [Silvibacterium sp.]